MSSLDVKTLSPAPEALAPDGTQVRLLCALAGGSLAHFELAPGAVSRAVAHRSVEEIWYFLSGRGQLWRRLGEAESLVDAAPGLSLTIPLGAHFQLRADAAAALTFLAVTMPPWPGAQEAYRVEGPWRASVA